MEERLELFNTANFIIMYDKELVVYSKDNKIHSFIFDSIEERHQFLKEFPIVTTTSKNGTVYPALHSSYTNYLLHWSEGDFNNTNKQLCPPYDYIIMELREHNDWTGFKSIVVIYKHFEKWKQ